MGEITAGSGLISATPQPKAAAGRTNKPVFQQHFGADKNAKLQIWCVAGVQPCTGRDCEGRRG